MKKHRLIFLFVLCTINVCAQTVENDSIFKMFLKLREQETNTLLNYRYTETDILGYDNYGLCTAYYKLSFGNSNYYKGIDISYHGIYADTIIHNRIIQLLKGNYFIGEIDTARKEIEKPITYSKYRELLHACRYVDNFEIKNLLTQMYHDEKYSDYKEDIYEYLLYKHIEPYSSIRLNKCKFNKSASFTEQQKCVNYLSLIATQKSYRFLADYLFSDKYMIGYEYEDAEDTEDATLTSKIINDTTIEIIDNILLDIENDINSITDVFESKDYIWKDVVVTLLYNIENQDFLDLAKCKVTASQLHYDTDYTFSPRVISQMYNWMVKNYGNYKIRNRW